MRLCEKFFINAIQPVYGCQRNTRKNITITVTVGVNLAHSDVAPSDETDL